MIQQTQPLPDVSSPDSTELPAGSAPAELEKGRMASIWVGRVTSIVGAICLLLALLEWATRPGHLRTVLALLVVAMFAAILHSYTFEDGH